MSLVDHPIWGPCDDLRNTLTVVSCCSADSRLPDEVRRDLSHTIARAVVAIEQLEGHARLDADRRRQAAAALRAGHLTPDEYAEAIG